MNQDPFSIAHYQFFLGVDWGSQTHELCLIAAGGQAKPQRRRIRHEPQCLAQMLEWIDQHIGGKWAALAVAIERPHGLLVQVLLARRAAVFAINPKQLDSFRTRYSCAGAKDDRLDALVLADTLAKDAYAYQQVTIQPENELLLRELNHTLEDVEQDWRRQCNRLWDMLVSYYPALLEVAGGADEPWLWELLEAAPTPQQGATLSLESLAALLRRNRIRRLSAEQLHELLQQRPLELAPGFAPAQAERTLSLLRCLRPLHAEVRRLEARIAATLETIKQAEAEGRREPEPAAGPTDFEIINSLTGIGPHALATFYSEGIETLRHGQSRRMRALCGTAPVTERSGKSCSIQMRYACNRRLRQALHHAANCAWQRVPHWGACYKAMRKAGHSHGRALRGIGDRMLQVLASMLFHRTLFDPDRVGRIQTGQLKT